MVGKITNRAFRSWFPLKLALDTLWKTSERLIRRLGSCRIFGTHDQFHLGRNMTVVWVNMKWSAPNLLHLGSWVGRCTSPNTSTKDPLHLWICQYSKSQSHQPHGSHFLIMFWQTPVQRVVQLDPQMTTVCHACICAPRAPDARNPFIELLLWLAMGQFVRFCTWSSQRTWNACAGLSCQKRFNALRSCWVLPCLEGIKSAPDAGIGGIWNRSPKVNTL